MVLERQSDVSGQAVSSRARDSDGIHGGGGGSGAQVTSSSRANKQTNNSCQGPIRASMIKDYVFSHTQGGQDSRFARTNVTTAHRATEWESSTGRSTAHGTAVGTTEARAIEPDTRGGPMSLTRTTTTTTRRGSIRTHDRRRCSFLAASALAAPCSRSRCSLQARLCCAMCSPRRRSRSPKQVAMLQIRWHVRWHKARAAVNHLRSTACRSLQSSPLGCRPPDPSRPPQQQQQQP